jgi:hypothetical protein
MFSLKIVDTDLFLDMPMTTRLLYYDLNMRADDDGFVASPKKIQKMVGCSDDDLKLLIAKNFIIPFESGICVIKHWRVHNYIRNDRYAKTIYNEEKQQLVENNNVYENVIPTVDNMSYQRYPQVRLGKDSIGKSNNIYMSDSDEYRLSEYLFKHMKANNDKAKEPNIQSWCKVFDKILRIDKRELEEVKTVIKWCQHDNFWYKNILSPAKLREQYDKLYLQMKGDKDGFKNAPGVNSKFEGYKAPKPKLEGEADYSDLL